MRALILAALLSGCAATVPLESAPVDGSLVPASAAIEAAKKE